MRVVGRKKLERLKRKNKGNYKLIKAIEQLILDLKNSNWISKNDLRKIRPNADCVHSDGFYFFNIDVHRILILIEFDEEGEATIIWVGTHKEYEKVFKNNKNTIKKWLRSHDYL